MGIKYKEKNNVKILYEEKNFLIKLLYLVLSLIFLLITITPGEETFNGVNVTLITKALYFFLTIFFLRKFFIAKSYQLIFSNNNELVIIKKHLRKTEKIRTQIDLSKYHLNYYAVNEKLKLIHKDSEENLTVHRKIIWVLQNNEEAIDFPKLYQEKVESNRKNQLMMINNTVILFEKAFITKRDLDKINSYLSKMFGVDPLFAGFIDVKNRLKELRDPFWYNVLIVGYFIFGIATVLIIYEGIKAWLHGPNSVLTQTNSLLAIIGLLLLLASFFIIGNIVFYLFFTNHGVLFINQLRPFIPSKNSPLYLLQKTKIPDIYSVREFNLYLVSFLFSLGNFIFFLFFNALLKLISSDFLTGNTSKNLLQFLFFISSLFMNLFGFLVFITLIILVPGLFLAGRKELFSREMYFLFNDLETNQ